ncbi:hypothetical protein CEY11_02150 [Candidimonas nitroreducens]|uniref:Uncharacterized protein n=1 Tax=Candidimonas nitroreducens TaxID=683354 RepID=A0A225N3F8_9BURK|nr:hypothetical protein CEY11_02150 [Candidimonas nitroreducens]
MTKTGVRSNAQSERQEQVRAIATARVWAIVGDGQLPHEGWEWRGKGVGKEKDGFGCERLRYGIGDLPMVRKMLCAKIRLCFIDHLRMIA